jgi:hypothetical protein
MVAADADRVDDRQRRKVLVLALAHSTIRHDAGDGTVNVLAARLAFHAPVEPHYRRAGRPRADVSPWLSFEADEVSERPTRLHVALRPAAA